MGYDTILEAIVKTYRRTGSAAKTGKVNGNISSAAVYRVLHRINEPVYDQRKSQNV